MFLINLLYSLGCTILYDKYKNKIFIFIMLVFWIGLMGFQYEVGTDYDTYLKYFNGIRDVQFFKKDEILFYYLVKSVKFIGVNGQGLFFVVATLQMFIFYKILNFKNFIKNKTLFIFLYLCYTTIFHSQLNGLRQCIAVYFFTIAILESKIKQYLYFITGVLFHKSLIILLPILIFKKIFINKKIYTLYFFIFFGTFLLYFINFENIFESLYKIVTNCLGIYRGYVGSDFLISKPSIVNVITRYMYIPLYYIILYCIYKKRLILTRAENEICSLGILFYILKIIGAYFRPISRLSLYGEILMIYPVYIFLLKSDISKTLKKMIILVILFSYLLKICVFPSAEFLYKSYLFR